MDEAGETGTVPEVVTAKEEEDDTQKSRGQLAVEKIVMMAEGENDELIEVKLATKEANDVFNRVKSEKIAEQALNSIRNDHAAYEGLAKEIVGKAIKQRERERANRASAAASRAKVIKYQTELENRLNRVEAERNYLRAQVSLHEESDTHMLSKEMTKMGEELQKLRTWLKQVNDEKPGLIKSVTGVDDLSSIQKGSSEMLFKRRRLM